MKKKIQLVDADYQVNDGEVTVRCFGKTENGESILYYDRNFLPYVYVLPKEEVDTEELKELIEEESFEEDDEPLPVREVEILELKELKDKKEVLKVYSNIPAKIPKLKNKFWDLEEVEECREFDIPFYRRYLIDEGIRPASWIQVEGEEVENDDFDVVVEADQIRIIEEKPMEKEAPNETEEPGNFEWNAVAFDLEVYEEQVIMASFYGEDFRKVLTTEKIDREFVETVKSEKELIQRFVEIVKEKNIDILTGYNTDEFDFDVLRERSNKHDVTLALGLDGERMKFNRRGRFKGARLKGRMHLDLYPFISHVISPGLESETLDLDSVAEELLGLRKDDLSWEEMKISWKEKQDLEEFADYSLKDSELAFKLAEELVPQMLELSRITGLIPFDACRLTYGQLTENYLLREAHERDMMALNRPSQDKRQKRQRQGAYSGGFVYTPDAGLYNSLALFDFKSLPPDEKVYLKNPKGDFVRRKIGVLDNKVEDTSGWKALSFNTETMKVEWRELRKIISHNSDFDELVKFKTETGKTITLTPNHSVYTLNDDGVPCVRDAKEVSENDCLISPKRLPLDQKSSIDIFRLLRCSDVSTEKVRLFLPRDVFPPNERKDTWDQILRLVEEEKEIDSVKEKVDRHPKTVLRNIGRMKENGFLDHRDNSLTETEKGRNYRKILSYLDSSEFSDGYYLYSSIGDIEPEWLTSEMWERGFLKLDNAYWSRKMPLKWSPDEEMCWSMGMFVAEGWTDSDYSRVHFSNTDADLLERLEMAFDGFGPERVRDEGDQEVRAGGGIFGRVFATLFGRTSSEKKISDELFSLSENKKKRLVEGMVDGDGSVDQKSFKYTTCSRRLASDLQNLLLSMEISQTALRKSRDDLYDLRVLSKPDQWKDYEGERQKHPLNLIPREYAKESITQELKWGHRGQRIDENRVFNNLEDKKPELAFFEGDSGLEKIVERKKVESGKKLYDLSVEENQNFFAGEMPVLVHNSLYPTVMVAHNISPDTLNLEGCDDRFELDEFDYNFCQDEKGFFPELVEELVRDRSKIKKQMKEAEEGSQELQILDNRQQAEKILANSFYGYLGYNSARWYSRESAEAITYLGRKHIQDTIEKAEEEGFEVVYGDTDSVFLKKDNIREEMDEFLDEVNEQLPEFMQLEFEGFFTRGFFTSTESGEGAKKKYALLSEDGSMKITGFEQVRRDWSPIAKKTQKKVLRKVLENDVGEAAEIVKETIQKLKNGEIPVEDLKIYTTLTKPPEDYDSTAPHVEAVKKAKKRGDEIPPETTVAYVIGRGPGSISSRAELLKYAEDYDPDYYIDNQVIPVTLRVLKVFGYTEGQVKGKGKQSGLGRF